MAILEPGKTSLTMLAVLLALASCTVESSLGDVTCSEDGARDGNRVCQDGYWVSEGDNLDAHDAKTDGDDEDTNAPDVSPDTSDTESDTDGGECVPTTQDETTCDQMDNDCDGDVDEGLTTEYFYDNDGDGFGDPLQSTERCDPPQGPYVLDDRDCDDNDAEVNPDIVEECISAGNCPYCNGFDDNCNDAVDEMCPCDASENEEQRCFPFPGASPDNGPCEYGNQVCVEGTFGECTGFEAPRDEVCDGTDNDCDGTVDDGVKNTYYRDADGDGIGTENDEAYACSAPSGYVDTKGDCDDDNDAVYPGASETCNNINDDCDNETDEGVTTTYYRDDDGDGYGVDTDTVQACAVPNGYADVPGDCDDGDNTINPGANEVCNGVNDDCDNQTDEGVKTTYFEDADGDTYGDPNSTQDACMAPSGFVGNSDDCDDSDAAVNPDGTEVCNGVNDDCDRETDEGVKTTYFEDADGDTYGDPNSTQDACMAPSGFVGNSDDCDDSDAAVNPDGTEVCNGINDDCDNETDEGVTTTYYRDADEDTYGTPDDTQDACGMPPVGYVDNSDDCDDTDPWTYEGATELCDNWDNDCDGDKDERSQTDAWCGAQSLGPSSPDYECDPDDAPDGGPCCEITGDGDEDCEFESRCRNEYGDGTPVDDDDDGAANCADSDCDGYFCDDGKVCNASTGNCEAI